MSARRRSGPEACRRKDPAPEAALSVSLHESIDEIGQRSWDACACPEARDGGRPEDPFTTHRFLRALEESGSVGPGTGWSPRYMSVESDGEVVAVAPLYLKTHSQGEYVFDFAWADAFERAGGRYYPKLQIAVPFTPVSGRRLLAKPGWERAGGETLLHTGCRLAQSVGLSSLHVTFCTAEEAEAGRSMGLMPRASRQFHWFNDGYQDFDGFLASLASRKRKAIRRERERAMSFGGTIEVVTGERIAEAHWDAMWEFYQDTGARKWGVPYLTREFFEIAHRDLRGDALLVFAMRDGRAVAGAMSMIGRSALFGRYWGCVESHPCLHFELCYHQSIEYAVAHGLERVEAGAQGEHKLARGYMPVETHSLHWIANRGFADAVARFLEAEREAVEDEMEFLADFGPFRSDAAGGRSGPCGREEAQ